MQPPRWKPRVKHNGSTERIDAGIAGQAPDCGSRRSARCRRLAAGAEWWWCWRGPESAASRHSAPAVWLRLSPARVGNILARWLVPGEWVPALLGDLQHAG